MRRRRVVLRPSAESDLEDIWEQAPARRWAAGQPEIYTRQLWQDIKAMAAKPYLGRPCPEVARGYHAYRSGAHIVFYTDFPDGIEVVRILYERIDYERKLS